MKFSWPHFRSFFSDIKVRTIKTSTGETLTIYLSRGRYIINSGFVNYAFGSVHNFFIRSFNYLDIPKKWMQEVLVLGFGAGDVASLLLSKKTDLKITGVEYNPEIIELGKEYLNFNKETNISIVEEDAFEFIVKNNHSYDLIVIDLFAGDEVPGKFYQKEFIEGLYRSLNNNGIVFFNHIGNTQSLKEKSEKLRKKMLHVFGNAKTLSIMGNKPIYATRNPG